jgi:N-acetylglutamate synthase-like GNAT family acetyltransferase
MPKRAPTEIIDVTTTEQWQAYHRIRRQVLYEDRGRFGVYDENHPDDYRIGHFPLLILASGQPVGAARLDCVPGSLGIVRSVAISPEFQRMGFGRSLMIGLEQHAANLGMRSLDVNSAPDAVGFYEKLGWVLVDRQRSSPLLRKAAWP